MSSEQPVIADLLTWLAASKRTSPRWPALIGVAGTVVMVLNLALRGNHELEFGSVEMDTRAAACLFGSLAFATFPVWYFDTDRLMQGRPRLSWMKKWLVCAGLFLVALVLSPAFSIAFSKFDEMRHSTTTWIKRSLLESVERPFYGHDELVWAGTGADIRYIPLRVFCPSYSVRLYPLFGLQHGDNWPDVIADRAALLLLGRTILFLSGWEVAVVITVIQLLIAYWEDDDLQLWMQKCAFGKSRNDPPWSPGKQHEGFEKALKGFCLQTEGGAE